MRCNRHPALREFPILGIHTNIPFVRRILAHETFRRAEIHTGFLDAEGAALAIETDATVPEFVRAAVGFADDSGPATAGAGRWDPWDERGGWRP